MFEAPLELSSARILLSNDDGIDATGLELLEKIARTFTDDVWVVAPEDEQSGASHSLTLMRPLRLRRLSERRFAVNGTPTDAVLMAVHRIIEDRPPDLLLSGINRGGNLGEDVTYSGTIAAAMEGTLLGIPSIALSQLVAVSARVKWSTAERFAAEAIRRLTSVRWPKNVFMNVNFPDVPAARVSGFEVVSLGRRKIGGHFEKRVDPRGFPYYWIGATRDESSRPNTDIATVNAGGISVTPVHLDLTHRRAMKSLRQAFP